VCNDGNPCTDDACHPAAGCTFTPNALSCDDGSACTTGDACAGGGCVGTPVACPSCERCDPATGTCTTGARVACASGSGTRAALRLRKAPLASGDLLTWKWRRTDGTPADFGNPLASDAYALCVYDAADSLVLRSDALAAAGCGSSSCWAAKAGQSYVYRDVDGTPTGLLRLLLKTKPGGATKLAAKGKGPNLAMPSPVTMTLPLRTQLHGPGAVCWEAAFGPAHVQRQDATQLKAKLP
jgi:hypothetical protein